MGLDMYLIGKNSDGTTSEVAYWRKANSIHAWFVHNCQDDLDECQESVVSREQLRELVTICHKVLDNVVMTPGRIHTSTVYPSENGQVKKYEDGLVVSNPELCEELLPTQNGFFFGSTDYNEYYIKNSIESTIKQIEVALSLEYKEFYYNASW